MTTKILVVVFGGDREGVVLAAKAKNPQADTSPLEREIDELARSGQLYGLTQEEIEIVDYHG